MTIMVFIMCAICFFSLSCGYQTLVRPETQEKPQIIFTLLCLTNSALSFAYIFLLTSHDINQLIMFRHVVVVCLPLTGFLAAWLILSVSGNESKYLRVILAGLATLGVIVIVLITIGSTIEYSDRNSYTVNYVFNKSIGILLLAIHEFVALLVCGYILFLWRKNAKYKREKIQAWIYLIACSFVALSLILVTLIPILGVNMPPLSSVCMFIFIVSIYNISKKYSTFNITFENIANQIYSDVTLPIIVTDKNNQIILANEITSDFFHLGKNDITSLRVSSLFSNAEAIQDCLTDASTDNIEFETKSANGRFNLEVQKTNYKDSYDDLICSIFIIHDITESKKMIARLNESVEEAEIANNAKSSFLANMSHEIRTPMNAIIGMAEVALQNDNSPETTAHLNMIQSSGLGLVTIINDILDFSKIESGKMELAEHDYIFSSIIVDIVNMFAVKLMNSDVMFIVNVNPNIPMYFVGDEIRIKQILVNIIGNAVKFTNKGFIRLDVDGDWVDEKNTNNYRLQFKVTDTGIGIKKEDIDNLFGMFSQVDTTKNREIKGTGLGLTIARNISQIMGGDINVESTYGKGSTFTIQVNQKTLEDNQPLVSVENPKEKMVLIYEPDKNLRSSFEQMLTNLSIPFKTFTDSEEYIEDLKEMIGTHAAIREEILDSKIKDALIKIQDCTKLILVTSIYSKPNTDIECSEVYLPLYSFQIADILNNKEPQTFAKNRDTDNLIIPVPDARVLVVDDTYSNLQVAQGLLASYKMTVDSATSGKDAIELVQKNDYDAVFMDHMMPEMDGIEATRIIRGLGGKYSKLTIIALTANATVGAREMFMNEGFDDFIAKPIDISKLRAIVKKWLVSDNSKELIIDKISSGNLISNNSQELKITTSEHDLIDYDKGLGFLGGDSNGFFSVLKTYYTSLDEKVRILNNSLENEDMKLYSITAHSLKSSSMSLGIKDVSIIASELEKACKVDHMEAVRKQHKELIDLINMVKKEINERFCSQLDTIADDELSKWLL